MQIFQLAGFVCLFFLYLYDRSTLFFEFDLLKVQTSQVGSLLTDEVQKISAPDVIDTFATHADLFCV